MTHLFCIWKDFHNDFVDSATVTSLPTVSQPAGFLPGRGIECLLNDNHQKGKMMIMIMKTSGSQVDSPVAEGKRKEGGGRKIRDLHRDT